MANEPQSTWPGASGKNYVYTVFPRHPNLRAGILGNYIYAKLVGDRYQAIYIGQGDLSVRCTKSHHQISCINTKGATSVHVHANASEADRLAEERDLLANNTNAYAPSGCNIKTGG
jgi:hypothetical protein